MVFGGRASFAPTSLHASTRILERGMHRVFPRLRGTAIDYAWWGNVGMTVDQLPHAGVADGIHYALGYCGHGVAMSSYLGDRIGRMIAGRGDLSPFSELAFAAIPLYRGRPWFLPLVGAYYRLRDMVR
jgi:glycine/D-amino acid oxidase-like deaminating enzyme